MKENRFRPLSQNTLLVAAMLLLCGFAANSENVVRNVTARSLVNNICGCIDPSLCKEDLLKCMQDSLQVVPCSDEDGIWLDSADGFNISYEGMSPNLSVLVRLDRNGAVEDYTYFFIFPYSEENQSEANSNQAKFCGMMLQELYDLQSLLRLNDVSAIELFDIDGCLDGRHFNVNLIDDPYTIDPPLIGQYLLVFGIDNTLASPVAEAGNGVSSELCELY